MFSRINRTANVMPSFIISDKLGKPQAIFVSNDHAKDPEVRRLLLERKKQGKLLTIDELKIK